MRVHFRYILLIVLSFSPFLSSQESRTWTDLEGRSFVGSLVDKDDESVVVKKELDGVEYSIPKRSLSPTDLNYLSELDRALEEEAQLALAATLIEWDDVDHSRDNIPSINQADFRGGRSSCGPTSILNFLVWWNNEIEPVFLPKMNKEISSIKRAQQRLLALCHSAGGTTVHDLNRGLQKYFDRYIEDYSLEIEINMRPTKKWLIEHSQEWDGIVIGYDYRKAPFGVDAHKVGHFVSFIKLDEEGFGLVSTWGKKYPITVKKFKAFHSEKSKPLYQQFRLDDLNSNSENLLFESGQFGMIKDAIAFKLRKVNSPAP